MSHPIVLGYDGSLCSTGALDEAVALAGELGHGEIVIVYCHEPPPGLSCELDPACAAAKELRDYERSVEEDVEPMLHAAAERARGAGLQTDVLLVWDDPARALIQIAHDRGSRVIVVGSHGEGPLSGALHHCTPYELLHRSSIPVLVVPYRN
jgi:nucleotide-binding universal stress UspA family protein